VSSKGVFLFERGLSYQQDPQQSRDANFRRQVLCVDLGSPIELKRFEGKERDLRGLQRTPSVSPRVRRPRSEMVSYLRITAPRSRSAYLA
jgi:hypothetical protein